MAASQSNLNTVQDLYIAFYDRPADQGGLNNWANALASNGGNIQSILSSFANSTEAQNLYGTITPSNVGNVINQIYEDLFNRGVDPTGLQSWTNVYKSNPSMSPGELAWDILNNAQNSDVTTINNKLQAANVFTNTVGSNYSEFARIAKDFINQISSSTNVASITPTTVMEYPVQDLYIAFYDRPADQGGLNNWANALASNGGNIQSILSSFANSTEAQNLYGTITPSNVGNVINQIYEDLFNRGVDPTGLQSWTNVYKSNPSMSPGELAWDILNNAQNSDVTTINNKLQAANVFTDTFGSNYSSSTIPIAKDFINQISSSTDVASITPTFVNQYIISPSTAQTTTYSLTTGIDNLVGSNPLNDVFQGTYSTWTTGDSITGAQGSTNTFNLADDRGTSTDSVQPTSLWNLNPQNTSVSDIQNVNVTSQTAVSIDTTQWTGVTSLNIIASDYIAATQTNTGGSTVTSAPTTNINFTDSNLAGNTDTITGGQNVTINESGVNGGSVNVYGLNGTQSVSVVQSLASTNAGYASVAITDFNSVGGNGYTGVTATPPSLGTITNVSLYGVGINGATITDNNLKTLTVDNAPPGSSGENVIINDNSAISGVPTALTLNVSYDGSNSNPTTITESDSNNSKGQYTTLSISTGTQQNYSHLALDFNALNNLTISGSGTIDLDGLNTPALSTISITGAADFNVSTVGDSNTLTLPNSLTSITDSSSGNVDIMMPAEDSNTATTTTSFDGTQGKGQESITILNPLASGTTIAGGDNPANEITIGAFLVNSSGVTNSLGSGTVSGFSVLGIWDDTPTPSSGTTTNIFDISALGTKIGNFNNTVDLQNVNSSVTDKLINLASDSTILQFDVNSGGTYSGSYIAQFSGTSGPSDTANVVFNHTPNDSSPITINSLTLQDSATSPNGIGTLNITDTVVPSSGALSDNITTLTDNSLTTLNIDSNNNFAIGTLYDNTTSPIAINLSGTGTFSLGLDNNNSKDITITGGQNVFINELNESGVNGGSVNVYGLNGTQSVSVVQSLASTNAGYASVAITDFNSVGGNGYTGVTATTPSLGTITNVSLYGVGINGATITDNNLQTLTVDNASATSAIANVGINDNSAISGVPTVLTLNVNNDGSYTYPTTITESDSNNSKGQYTTLNVVTGTESSNIALANFNSLTNLNIEGSSTLTLMDLAQTNPVLSTVAISGAAGFTSSFNILGTASLLPTSLTSITDSSSGVVNVVLPTNATNTNATTASFDGSKATGQEIVTITQPLAPNASIQGGTAANNELVISPAFESDFQTNSTTGAINSLGAGKISGFEVLGIYVPINSASTFDIAAIGAQLGKFSNTVDLQWASGATLYNLANNSTLQFGCDNYNNYYGGIGGITAKFSDTSGSNDTANVVFNHSPNDGSPITISSLTLQDSATTPNGIGTLNITDTTVANLGTNQDAINLADNSLTNLNINSNNNFTINSLTDNTISPIAINLNGSGTFSLDLGRLTDLVTPTLTITDNSTSMTASKFNITDDSLTTLHLDGTHNMNIGTLIDKIGTIVSSSNVTALTIQDNSTNPNANSIDTLVGNGLTSLTFSGSHPLTIGTLSEASDSITLTNTGTGTVNIGSINYNNQLFTSLSLNGNIGFTGLTVTINNIDNVGGNSNFTGFTLNGSTDNANVTFTLNDSISNASNTSTSIVLGNGNNTITLNNSITPISSAINNNNNITVGSGNNTVGSGNNTITFTDSTASGVTIKNNVTLNAPNQDINHFTAISDTNSSGNGMWSDLVLTFSNITTATANTIAPTSVNGPTFLDDLGQAVHATSSSTPFAYFTISDSLVPGNPDLNINHVSGIDTVIVAPSTTGETAFSSGDEFIVLVGANTTAATINTSGAIHVTA